MCKKDADEALRASEEKYRTLFNTIDEGFCIFELLYDSQGSAVDWIYTEANPAFEQQTGYIDPVGKRISDFQPTLERSWFERFAEVARTGEPQRFVQYSEAQGVWYDVYALRVGEAGRNRVSLLFTDITERKLAEEALRRSTDELAAEAAALARLQQASTRLWRSTDLHAGLEEILDASIALLGADMGNVQLLNVATQKLEIAVHRGFGPEFLEVFREVSTEEDSACGRSLRTGGRIIIEDVEVDAGFAPYRPIAAKEGFRAVQSTPLLNVHGEPLGMLSTHFRAPHRPSQQELRRIDLYASQVVEFIERQRIDAALRRADERKNEFLATLAHELRNPLAPLRSGLSILEAIGEPSAEAVRTREVMERQLTHLVRLVDDLLDVSRVSQGKVELRKSVHSLQSVVELALETSRPVLAAAGHQLQVVLPSEPVLLSVDATRIAQVVTNILNNATKYSPQGSQVRLLAERVEPARVRLQVEDNGMGIPSDMLDSVFDLFTQVSHDGTQTKGGLGIGLSLSRRLVELHGGKMRASSAGLGKGSTFTVDLPAMPPKPAHEAWKRASGAAPESKVGRRSVLVVDDNVDAAAMLAIRLRLDGHEVRVAHTGNDALSAFGFDEAPDIVFLDIGLPDRSGYEVAQELRRRPAFDRTVLVALTGWGADRDRQRAHDAGFDAHLTKPASPGALVNALASERPPTRARPLGPPL